MVGIGLLHEWKFIASAAIVSAYAVDAYFNYRQYKATKRTKPSSSTTITLLREFDKSKFLKSQKYANDKVKFNCVKKTVLLIRNLLFLNSTYYVDVWNLSGALLNTDLVRKYAPVFLLGPATQSLVFMNIGMVIGQIITGFLDYFSAFGIEEKYGFNKMSRLTYWLDFGKLFCLSFAIETLINWMLFRTIVYFGPKFPIYAGAMMLLVMLLILTLFPNFILPLFYKLTPLPPGELRSKIDALNKSQKFPCNRLFIMEASTKSSHSNAMFIGLPWSKSIVLFDVLVSNSTHEEILAVLGHELGHWKLNHLPLQFSNSIITMLLEFQLFAAIYKNVQFYEAFHFANITPDNIPVMVGFTIFRLLISPMSFFIELESNYLTRVHENDADKFALRLGYGNALASGLIRLELDNLSFNENDWLYEFSRRSHPTLEERLKNLEYDPKNYIYSEKK